MTGGRCENCKELEVRRDALLALVADLSRTMPVAGEVAELRASRAALLAEVGTLRARVEELL